jgi:hypothetical protein
MNDKLLANVRFYFAQSVFMNSIHYKAFGNIKKRKNVLSKTVLWCASITIVLLILQVVGLENNNDTIIKIVTYVGLLLTAITTVLEIFNKDDLSLLMFQHKNIAEKYKTLRDEYMSLIEEIMSNNLDEEKIREKKDKLQKRYSEIGENAPETNFDNYKEAQLGLGLDGNSGEEFTWADKEIDKFLPEQLRLNK